VSRLVKGGAVGLAVLATARWLLRNPTPNQNSAEGAEITPDPPPIV
jgi:hypothetical protein